MIKEINSIEEYSSIISDAGYSVIGFIAPWCEPANIVDAIIEEVSKKFEGKCNFYIVDADKHANIVMKNMVMYIPSFIVTSNGKEINRLRTCNEKSDLVDFLSKNLK